MRHNRASHRAQQAADAAAERLQKAGRLLRKAPVTPDGRAVIRTDQAVNNQPYRERWAHDKVVRSTHGVNCTGSCSWQVYGKDGLITWEMQATDYPSTGPDRPDYEPRGCPRGASFSWYTYSPTRVRHPLARGVLVEMFREAKRNHGDDPVAAWAAITGDPQRHRRYQSARGKGGLVHVSWDEALEIASPQVFGDQTDVPESGDWWDAAYLMLWGPNVPVTRTPDAHWMAEARSRGQKGVVVSPDYADATKFADEWLHPHPGTDGALALARGHVILKECFVDRQVPYFTDYVKRFTDLPFLVELAEREDGAHVPGAFLTAQDADMAHDVPAHTRRWMPLLWDAAADEPVVPHGTLGDRWSEASEGRWNLDLGEIDPLLSLYGRPGASAAQVVLPRFDQEQAVVERAVPALRLGGRPVTTVFDLMLAQYGVGRAGWAGRWPTSYEDASLPCTPAWQETVTSVPARAAVRAAREFARTAERIHGRCMIVMGAGTNHWFHSDTIYRSFLSLLLLTGCQGVNGGGRTHYVGQEKVRPYAGWPGGACPQGWHDGRP